MLPIPSDNHDTSISASCLHGSPSRPVKRLSRSRLPMPAALPCSVRPGAEHFETAKPETGTWVQETTLGRPWSRMRYKPSPAAQLSMLRLLVLLAMMPCAIAFTASPSTRYGEIFPLGRCARRLPRRPAAMCFLRFVAERDPESPSGVPRGFGILGRRAASPAWPRHGRARQLPICCY